MTYLTGREICVAIWALLKGSGLPSEEAPKLLRKLADAFDQGLMESD